MDALFPDKPNASLQRIKVGDVSLNVDHFVPLFSKRLKRSLHFGRNLTTPADPHHGGVIPMNQVARQYLSERPRPAYDEICAFLSDGSCVRLVPGQPREALAVAAPGVNPVSFSVIACRFTMHR